MDEDDDNLLIDCAAEVLLSISPRPKFWHILVVLVLLGAYQYFSQQ